MSLSYTQNLQISPVFQRDQSRDSNGCLTCENVDTSCPKDCSSDEECLLSTQTCNSCPKSYCSKKDSASSGQSTTSPVGGIIGGVIGGVAVLALLAGFLYYRLVYRKKHPVSLDDEDMAMSQYGYDDYDEEYDEDYADYHDDSADGKHLQQFEGQNYPQNHNNDRGVASSPTTTTYPHINDALGTTTTTTLNTPAVSSTGFAAKSTPTIVTTTTGPAAGGGTENEKTNDLNDHQDQTQDIPLQHLQQQHQQQNTPQNPQQRQRPLASRSAQGTSRRNARANRRLSSYESFTRPKVKYDTRDRRVNNSVGGRGGGRRGRGGYTRNPRTAQRGGHAGGAGQQYNPNANSNNLSLPHLNSSGPYNNDPNNSNRNSIATSVSTTNASNILPIAYIPGVTVRPTRNNTRSVYSYETESIFSDLNTIENASIIGDVMRANNHNPGDLTVNNGGSGPYGGEGSIGSASDIGSGLSSIGEDNSGAKSGGRDATMTAIKAQPRLVNVERIEEEDEEEEDEEEADAEDEDEDDDDFSYQKGDTESKITNNDTLINSRNGSRGDLPLKLNPNQDSTLQEEVDNTDDSDSDDSDVDSDIGEITRATSLRRPQEGSSNNNGATNNENAHHDRELVINDGDMSQGFARPMPLATAHDKSGDSSLQSSNHGSFILDVEMDGQPQPSRSNTKKKSQTPEKKARPGSETSGEKSPFDDPE